MTRFRVCEFENEVHKRDIWHYCNTLASLIKKQYEKFLFSWVFNGFYNLWFSYCCLLVRHLWSSSATENLRLRRSLNWTKWCILVVVLIKRAGGPLVKSVCHLNTFAVSATQTHEYCMSDFSDVGKKLLPSVTGLHTLHMLWMCWASIFWNSYHICWNFRLLH